MVARNLPAILNPIEPLVYPDRRPTTEWWDFFDRHSKATVEQGSSFNNIWTSVSGDYVVTSTDRGNVINMTADALDSVTFGPPSAYAANHYNLIVNSSTTRGKLIVLNATTSPVLMPGQHRWVFSLDGIWYETPATRWMKPGAVFYVEADGAGTDNNTDGLAPDGAFQTINEAYGFGTQRVDSMGGGMQFILADGTHNVGSGVQIAYPVVGRSQVFFAGSSPSSCTVVCDPGGSCFSLQEPCTATIANVTLGTTGNGSVLFLVRQLAIGDLNNVDFNAAPGGTYISVTTLASCNILSSFTINGAASTAISVGYNSFLNMTTGTCTIAAPFAYSVFLSANFNCTVNGGIVFTGPGGASGSSGQQYSVNYNAVVNSGGTIFPGNVASGSTSLGGIYV